MSLSDLLIGGNAWWVVPVSLVVFGASFGLMPGLMLRLIVRLYPRDDSRRRELFAELYAPEMGRFERFEWVFQQLETALRDGREARRELRRRRFKLTAARENLPTFLRREFAGYHVAGYHVTVSCERNGTVRYLSGPDDLTLEDMASGTAIVVRAWTIRERRQGNEFCVEAERG